ncbi:hypothetical protein C2E20_8771 [Micractinium conductrix]|uniref:DNA repair and recombination RAD54 n=1 Tax=Micractinium conductrix TaxID=554055 RepID=A0A2P6V0H4_9CHLO|nr:hypothetical protein C2E20_8771 [Micractinium conductrix]|eukprot:PSC67575.1 hypothetical protein C2E20_8771 [Micractinium conductrix]
MPVPKRKAPEAEENEQLENVAAPAVAGGMGFLVLCGGGSCTAAGYKAVRKPFKPPMASRPEANGRGVQVGLKFSNLAQLGPGGLLQQVVTKTVAIGRRLGDGFADECDAPDVLLFDPADHPDLPPLAEGAPPYTRVLVDKFIAGKLRPHQVEGVQFMFKCLAGLKNPDFTGCIQSDSMGLGKTFQSICCMWMLLTSGLQGKPTCSRALVITPTSLVANWGREVDKWLGGRIKPVVIEDAAQLKLELQRLASYVPAGRQAAHVYVMSYDVFRLNQALVYSKKFELVICDEAHRLKNGQSKINQAIGGLPCRLRLLLTGTPIQNDLSEFFAMFNTACPGLFGTVADFRKVYEHPILAGRDSNATDKQLEKGTAAQQQLVALAQQYMIRRTSETLKQYLPAKIQEVIFCKMSPLQLSLYKGFLGSEAVAAALSGLKLEREKALATLPAINALKKLCCHPDMIWDLQRCAGGAGPSSLLLGGAGRASGRGPKLSAKAKASGEAPRVVVTGMNMWKGWSRASGLATFIPPTALAACRPCTRVGKMQVLVSLLKAIKEGHPGDKVVLVSNYTESLMLCDKVCKANRWGTLSLTGDLDARKRQALVDEFNSPAHPSFVLLLSSKAGGCGLNIIGANRLILLDPSWNPADDQQAMGRVWREGQKKDVFIYRLLTTGSIEEKIFQRQLAKEGLSRVVVDDNADEQRTFSKDELKALFRVDPAVQCDTHTCIKCSCGGVWPRPTAGAAGGPARQQSEDSEDGWDDDEEEGAGGAGGSGGKAAAEQASNPGSVLGWAHVKDVTLLPDDVWQRVAAVIRNSFITFAFSDFNLEERLDADKKKAEEEEDDDGDSIDRQGIEDREDFDPEDWEGEGGRDAAQEEEDDE